MKIAGWFATYVYLPKLRDRVVLATKFTFNAEPGNPNAGGNGRKNIYRALEASLRRLQTDYIDLYWLHAWDTVTPVEEVVSTLNDLVRTGKIRHYGFSDTPAWYVARAQTLTDVPAGTSRRVDWIQTPLALPPGNNEITGWVHQITASGATQHLAGGSVGRFAVTR